MLRGNEACSAAIESREVRGAYRVVVPRFTGKASEYFRIWIVDTALTLLTFGVFSPWAAARTRRYFARNTFVDGASFDYVGTPTAIACRRLVAVVLLGALLLASHHSFGIHWGLIVAAALSTPWLLLASRALELHDLRYRQVAFRFEGSRRDVFVECARAAVLMLASFGLAHPYVVFSLHRYLVTRCRWDGLRFDWHGHYGPYYGAYAFVACLTYPVYVAVFDFQALGLLPPFELAWALLPGVVFFSAYLLLPIAYLSASSKNLFYSGMHVGEHIVTADFRAQDLLKLYATNSLVVIASFGLLVPWAKVRVAAHEVSRLTLHVRR